jgi:hypothetical protein
MHLAETGKGFPVVMCHGFLELWYSCAVSCAR